jgi:hypothetical protein
VYFIIFLEVNIMVSLVNGIAGAFVLAIAIFGFKVQIDPPTFYTMLTANLVGAFAGGVAEGVKKATEKKEDV